MKQLIMHFALLAISCQCLIGHTSYSTTYWLIVFQRVPILDTLQADSFPKQQSKQKQVFQIVALEKPDFLKTKDGQFIQYDETRMIIVKEISKTMIPTDPDMAMELDPSLKETVFRGYKQGVLPKWDAGITETTRDTISLKELRFK